MKDLHLSLRIFEHLFYGNLGWLKRLSQKAEVFGSSNPENYKVSGAHGNKLGLGVDTRSAFHESGRDGINLILKCTDLMLDDSFFRTGAREASGV